MSVVIRIESAVTTSTSLEGGHDFAKEKKSLPKASGLLHRVTDEEECVVHSWPLLFGAK